MPDVGLLGASGYMGRLIARALDARGLGFVPAGRDSARVADAVSGLRRAAAARTVAFEPASLARLGDEVEVLVTTLGPFDGPGRVVAESVAGRCHYVDCSAEQRFSAWLLDRGPVAGRAAVTACGFDGLLGDLLAAVAAREVERPREVHVAYSVRGPRTLLSRGTRRTLARHLEVHGDEALALVDGTLVAERVGQHRRLAWLPRPFGPRRVAGWPGVAAVTVPRHLAGVRVVRTYLDAPGPLVSLAEILRPVAGHAVARRVAGRLLDRGPAGPGPADREATVWAVVADVVGEDQDRVRAWAAGRDPYGVAAEAMAAAAEQLLSTPPASGGTVSPAEIFDEDALDDLADRTGMRWSVREADERTRGG